MKYFVLFLFVIVSFCIPHQTHAHVTPYTIERSDVVDIKSEILDRSYDVYVKLPRSYSKDLEKDYPVIILTDGGYAFPLVSSISRQMSGAGKITEPIIVGLSYAKKESWKISRTRDYTPTHSPNEANYHSKEARKVSGGADVFAKFLDSELIPFLEKKYRIDDQKKIFAGHSFGGLLGGYILKSHPNTFDYYIISDPSFWYHNGSIFNIPMVKPTRSSKKPKVLMVAKRQPASEEPQKKNSHNLERDAQTFYKQLLAKPSFYDSVKFEVIDDEIHETLFPISVSHGMLQFLGK